MPPTKPATTSVSPKPKLATSPTDPPEPPPATPPTEPSEPSPTPTEATPPPPPESTTPPTSTPSPAAPTKAEARAAHLALESHKADIASVFRRALALKHVSDKDEPTFVSTILSVEQTIADAHDQSLRDLTTRGFHNAAGIDHPFAHPCHSAKIMDVAGPHLFIPGANRLNQDAISLLLTYFNLGVPILNDPVVCIAILVRNALFTTFLDKAASRYL